ncbi:conserved hypothetical protein [Talaromyces stipitatus ATCC 10500]|uniref:Uncharacterized protein n=1 Tax=Talaromyces stipitatus (strain ATCC 10500 / CBS 375.48 / QM 6759 / NRRL 1006) TaxID=441959 RepID=B8MJZ1_TALSN|nr:uncharacterized protein TSTA_042810 [Talaromyces stipitatus ATCC 10500]EED14808.1 conserved hypothetical protein [Talaromyces stipitatus ATCC 10500]
MGTRSLICIWYKGRFMVAQYCQWDGYLEGQGLDILNFLLVPGNIDRLKQGLEYITIVDDKTIEDLVSGHTYSTHGENGKVCECGATDPWVGPSQWIPRTLSRDAGAKIFDIIAAAKVDDFVPIQLALEFAQDGLFCEYAYCVDLDAGVFEVFGGHVMNPKKESIGQMGEYRFAEACKDAKIMPKLLMSFLLTELPKNLKEFLGPIVKNNEEFQSDDDDDEGEDEEEEEDDHVDFDETDKSEGEDNAKAADDKAVDVKSYKTGGVKAVSAPEDKKLPDSREDKDKKEISHDIHDIERERELQKKIEEMTMDEVAREIERETERETERMMMEEIGKELENEKKRTARQGSAGSGDKKNPLNMSVQTGRLGRYRSGLVDYTNKPASN